MTPRRLNPRLRAVVVGLVLAAGTAAASADYPAEIRSQLGLSYTPSCALCHTNGNTGIGTANTPFATSMRARGLVAADVASLDTALAALTAEMTDSDGDGVSDIDELKAGSDPNAVGGAITPPTYGCFNVTGQGPGPFGACAWLLVLATLAGFRRR
jgi:hypothetical protein